jgi:hypothetical protein
MRCVRVDRGTDGMSQAGHTRGTLIFDRVGSLVRCSLASRGQSNQSGGEGNASMAVQDELLEQRSARHNSADVQERPDQTGERSAQAHDRSADHFDQHAALLDRFGAHRCAGTERRHAEEEREAAEAARRN